VTLAALTLGTSAAIAIAAGTGAGVGAVTAGATASVMMIPLMDPTWPNSPITAILYPLRNPFPCTNDVADDIA